MKKHTMNQLNNTTLTQENAIIKIQMKTKQELKEF